MKCCVKCFKDPEIKAIIIGVKESGNCDFCGNINVNVCDVSNENLKVNFERLLDIYRPVSKINGVFPREQADLIKNVLCSKWNIFNLSPEKVYLFLKSILPEKYEEECKLFEEPVWIEGLCREEYLNQYSILGTKKWAEFVKEIKTKNRFHTNIINKEILKKILEVCFKEYEAGEVFYRARIWTEGKEILKEDMGAPPPNKASSGRANPEGISCLYLSDSLDVTLYETRVGVYDSVTVGKFILKENITVVNLTAIDKISPFLVESIDLLAANLEHLRKIGEEISRPLRKHDSNLEYLPTQYISEYIKSIGYSGIQYRSTMSNKGMNFAIFNKNLLECVEVLNYDVKSLKYDYYPIE